MGWPRERRAGNQLPHTRHLGRKGKEKTQEERKRELRQKDPHYSRCYSPAAIRQRELSEEKEKGPRQWAGARAELGLPPHPDDSMDWYKRSWNRRPEAPIRKDVEKPRRRRASEEKRRSERRRRSDRAPDREKRIVTRAAAFSTEEEAKARRARHQSASAPRHRMEVRETSMAIPRLRRGDRDSAALKEARKRCPSASVASARKRLRRSSNWDVMPSVEMLAKSHTSLSSAHVSRRRRECYIGGLVHANGKAKVSSELLQSALRELFRAIPDFKLHYPDLEDPIRSCIFPTASKGQFAFVEFHDEVLCVTAIQMSGVQILGKPIKIGRPIGFTPYAQLSAPDPLDVSSLRAKGLLPQEPDKLQGSGKVLVQVNRLRELFIGGLRSSFVDETAIADLLTPVCMKLPEYQTDWGPAVSKVVFGREKNFCFVTMQSQELAGRIIPIFHDIEFCGKKLRVQRPNDHFMEEKRNRGRAQPEEVPTLMQLLQSGA